MQVTETSSDGLKRELKVVIGAAELSERFDKKLVEVKDRVQIKGFRPGKVPVAHLKRVYGRSVMADVVQEAVNDSSQKALDERKERAAVRPDIKFSDDQAEIENVLGGKSDLAYSMSFEVLPQVVLTDLTKLELTRPVAVVGDAEMQKSLDRLLEANMDFEPAAGREAQTTDRVTIDFVGSIDGVEFPGGKGDDAPVVIGRGGFIPGFEEGLIGAKAGDQREVKAKFPADYTVRDLAGKEASFAVSVKEVAIASRPQINDEFAKKFNFDDVDSMKKVIRARMEAEFTQASRVKAKRALLDVLDTTHAFALPPTLVENEFKEIWGQVTRGLKEAGRTFEDEGKTEDGERQEYRKLAERRVRLGLVLSEVGEQAKIAVADEELARALAGQARRYPGQESQIYDFYRKNPTALAQLRAPIYEDKVVDHLLGVAKVNTVTVAAEDLFKDIEDEEDHAGHDHDHDHAHDHDHGHHHHGHDHDHDHDHTHDHDHDHDHGDHGHSQGSKS